MSFARPHLLPLIFVLPLLLAAAVMLYGRRRRAIAQSFSDAHLLGRLGGAELLRFPLARLLLIASAGAALGCALAGPRWGVVAREGRALSLNLVLAADISKSMLAKDLEPNRLERARIFARRLLRSLPGDRFGLVVFAGRAYILSPLTVDHSAIELYLDALDPAMVSQGGSSLAAALAQATDLVRGSEAAGGDRAVILLSDGEALEEEDAVRAAADRAARTGVKIIAIGVGTPAGSTIPEVDPATQEEIGLKRDEAGQVVMSRLGEDLLRSIADRTGGSYVRLDEAAALTRVVSLMRGMERTSGDATSRVEPRDRFALFAALGLLLLAIDTMLFGRMASERRRPRIIEQSAAPRTPPRRRRRGARAAVVAMVLVTSLAFGIGDLERGNRLYRQGKYEEAVAAYQKALAAGKSSPQLHYNLGTALLALGRFEEAEQQFQSALQGVDPELRQRTFYNLGNRFLNSARAEQDLPKQEQLLEGAIEAYRRALRIAPGDMDAKWNLELALRDREENEQQQSSAAQQDQQDSGGGADQQEQQQSGGSGGTSQSEEQADEGEEAGASRQERPMSEDQADRILNAIEQDERELTRQKLRRGQQRRPVLRDW